jgi:hypothetical protein
MPARGVIRTLRAMSFAPVVLGIVIVAGLLVAIAVMACDTGQQDGAADRESAASLEATAKPEERVPEPVERV